MKELQQCYSRACSRITELERQNAMLKEQIDHYVQDFSAELKNYVIIEKDTFEHLKECLCEAYAKFEALKQEGNSLEARYNEAIKGFKELERENKTLRANNKELCKQLKAAGKRSDLPTFANRSPRRHGNIWSQDNVMQPGWQFQPWMEVVRDLEQSPETKHIDFKGHTKASEDNPEKSNNSVSVKGGKLHKSISLEAKHHGEIDKEAEEFSSEGAVHSQALVNGSSSHEERISHENDSDEQAVRNKVVRIQITLQRSNSTASSKTKQEQSILKNDIS